MTGRETGPGFIRPWSGWLALPLAFLVWFCQHPEIESENVLLTLETDSSFQHFSRLWVGFQFEGEKDTLTLFDDSLKHLEELHKLPVPNRGSGKGSLFFRGFEAGDDGRLVYSEIRVIDMADGTLVSAETGLDLRTERVPPSPGAPTIEFSVRDTSISIGDTLTIAAILADSAGNLRSYAWDFSGSQAFSAPLALDQAVDTVFGAHVFRDTGVYAVSLKVVNEQRRETLKSMTVRVLLDEPRARAFSDSQVTAGDTLKLRGEGTDSLGRIVGYAWKIGTGAFQASDDGDTSFAAPLDPGTLVAVLRVTDDDGLFGFDTLRIEILASSSAFLGKLAIQGAALSPAFDKDSTAFSTVVGNDVAELSVELIPLHPGARISVSDGDLPSGDSIATMELKVGLNSFTIMVTAQDDTTRRDYELRVTRLADGNATLENLETSQGSLTPVFNSTTLNYADTVAGGISSVTVTPTASSGTAEILVQGKVIESGRTSDSISLTAGNNIVEIVVKARNGDSLVYRVDFYRPSGEAGLAGLDFTPELPRTAFQPSVLNYSDTVDFGVDSLGVSALAVHPGAAVLLNGARMPSGKAPKRIGLRTGANSLVVKVIAEDTAISKTYNVNVWRRRGYVKAIGGINDETGSGIARTADGGFIITGSADKAGTQGIDALLLKVDSAGDTLWSKTFGGAGADAGFTVLQTSDRGFFVAGRMTPPGRSDRDIYWFKTDSLGNKLWENHSGGSANEGSTGVGAQSTRDGGFIICSQTESFGSGAIDIYVLKTDAVGDTVWTKTFGGAGEDVSYSIQQTPDDGFVLVGRTQAAGGPNNLLLLKLTATGDTSWSRVLGGSGGAIGASVALTPDKGFIITGQDESVGGGDALLIKTDSLGNVQWSRSYGGNGADWGSSVLPAADGGYIVAGFTSSGYFGPNGGASDAFLMRVNSIGNPLWTRAYGGGEADAANSVRLAGENGFIAIGTVRGSPPSHGKSDIYLIRTDGSGDSD